jgi:hypothetical protein
MSAGCSSRPNATLAPTLTLPVSLFDVNSGDLGESSPFPISTLNIDTRNIFVILSPVDGILQGTYNCSNFSSLDCCSVWPFGTRAVQSPLCSLDRCDN